MKYVKRLIISLIAVFYTLCASGSELPDSTINNDNQATTTKFARFASKLQQSQTYQMLRIGVPLMAGAMIMKGADKHMRGIRNNHLSSFDHRFDDFLQYSPAVAMFGMKAFGAESRSSWGRMLTSSAFSATIASCAVNSLKYSVRTLRPDTSTTNSFPSGHTATAFVAATAFSKEYGYLSPLCGIAAYAAATTTGLMRMANNRHWLSDVMMGAGIGIVSAEVGYFLADLIFKEKGITKQKQTPPDF